MRTTQIRSLSYELLPEMPDYVHKQRMLYARPLNHILRAFYFEDSGFEAAAFYVWVFFLPLYVPATFVSFSFGMRLGKGSGKRWEFGETHLREELLDCITRDGLPFLEGVMQPCDVIGAIRRMSGDADPYGLEAIAYSITMTDDVEAAQRALERLRNALDRDVSWQAEMIERAEHLAKMLSADPQAVMLRPNDTTDLRLKRYQLH